MSLLFLNVVINISLQKVFSVAVSFTCAHPHSTGLTNALLRVQWRQLCQGQLVCYYTAVLFYHLFVVTRNWRNNMESHGITQQFLEHLVSQAEPGVTLQSFKVAAGSGRGDNYTSMLYRVSMTGTAEGQLEWQRSLIYKQLPTSTVHRQLYRSDQLFRNEVCFYKEALASLLDFQTSTGTNEPFSAVPKCLLAEQDLLVLEDLQERGFVMGNRREGLDYAHCAAIFREIAKFHALSLAMKTQDPLGFKEKVASRVQEMFFTEQNREYYRDYYNTLRKNALEAVECCLEESEKSTYLTKLKDFLDEQMFFQTMMSMVVGEEPLAVLCHGDFWTNNIMFRYSTDGTIQEVCFVDFQCVRYSSPALDLVNILSSCVSGQFRATHTESLLLEYCTILTSALHGMGCGEGDNRLFNCDLDNITHLIKQEVRTHHLFGLGLALDMIPILTCDSATAPDLYSSAVLPDGVSPVTPFGSEYNQECRLRMTELVRQLVDQGFL